MTRNYVIVIITLIVSGCQNYHAVYQATIYLHEKQDEGILKSTESQKRMDQDPIEPPSDGGEEVVGGFDPTKPISDQTLKSKTIKLDEPTSPKAKPRASLKYSYLIYRYGESFSMDYLPIWCGVSAVFYGGACWLYLAAPFYGDMPVVSDNAMKNLKMVLGNRKFTVAEEEVILGGYYDATPTYELRSPDYAFALRGDAPPKEGPIFIDDLLTDHAAYEDTESSEKPDDLGGKKEPYGIEAKPPVPLAPEIYYTYKGLQLGLHSGTAKVESYVEENGERYVVASGEVRHDLVSIAWRSLQEPGFYWSLSPQYSYERLVISDFAASLPEVEVAGSENIPVVVTDPRTRQRISLDEYINSYTIYIQSTNLMGGAGFIKRSAYQKNQPFWSLDGGLWVGLLHYFWNKIEFQNRTVKKQYLKAFGGLYGELNWYYNFPSYLSAIGLHLRYMYYPGVKMPDDMEFQGKPRYNAKKEVFERKRMFLDQVIYSSTTFGISYTYIIREYEAN